MSGRSYAKLLSANDTGATGGHQAGILVPKTDVELLAFFPPLDPDIKNPDFWIWCQDEFGKAWKFRFVYYNNKFHDPNGTRNEYRITWMTEYLRLNSAREGDSIVFVARDEPGEYGISVLKAAGTNPGSRSSVIKLSGWRRVH